LPGAVGSDVEGGGLCRRVNMVQILYTDVCKWKNDTCWNSSRNGGRMKENDGGGEFKYIHFFLYFHSFNSYSLVFYSFFS
jgi:hypothetical protein